jgi:lysophospholipase L1-like esterase
MRLSMSVGFHAIVKMAAVVLGVAAQWAAVQPARAAESVAATSVAAAETKKPKLFVLGDSISIQYGAFLGKMVAPEFDYSRKTGEEPQLKDTPAWRLGEDNGKHTNDCRVYIEYMLKDPNWRPDVMLLNAGIHDLTTMDQVTKVKQVPVDEYIKNLTTVLDAMAERKVPVIWVSTTPVDEVWCQEQKVEVKHYNADVKEFNEAAAKLMAEKGVPVIDLCTFTTNLGGREIFTDMCHFSEATARLQAAHIAGYLSAWRAAHLGK